MSAFALQGALGGAAACGARTSLGLVDESKIGSPTPDGAASCGAPGEPCCEGTTSCIAGFACTAGTCVAEAGTSVPGCPDGGCTPPPTPPTAPPSCASDGADQTHCGASGESCCTSLAVTGATYFRSYTNSGGGPMGEANPATVSSFRLDKYDVTVDRFRAFVVAWKGGWTPLQGSGKHSSLNDGRGLVNSGSPGTYEAGWLASNDGNVAPSEANLTSCVPYSTWTPSPGELEELPINCLNWYEGYAFCIWDGGFLPTEAEWEYAAVGGDEQREYPWGAANPGTANQYAIYDLDTCDSFSDAFCPGAGDIAPVGSATRGAGLWGQLDLVGELFQWNLDGYASYSQPCVDCADLTSTVDRVIQGGNFFLGKSYLLPTYRDYSTPANRSDDVGFRCARSAP